MPDKRPATIGAPVVHENGRTCYKRLDEGGWWPEVYEDGTVNPSATTMCLMAHRPAPEPETWTTIEYGVLDPGDGSVDLYIEGDEARARAEHARWPGTKLVQIVSQYVVIGESTMCCGLDPAYPDQICALVKDHDGPCFDDPATDSS